MTGGGKGGEEGDGDGEREGEGRALKGIVFDVDGTLWWVYLWFFGVLVWFWCLFCGRCLLGDAGVLVQRFQSFWIKSLEHTL